MNHKEKAFFLDRDGTINEDYDFVHKPEEWTFCQGAVESIRWMNDHDYRVIVVTNQSGVAREHFDLHAVYHLHRYVDDLLAKEGARIDGWYICPYHPNLTKGDLAVHLKDRKPSTGMFDKAIRRFNIDPAQSYMAGDKTTDLEPAVKLGMKPFYIRSRFDSEQDKSWLKKHDISEYDNIGQIISEINTNS